VDADRSAAEPSDCDVFSEGNLLFSHLNPSSFRIQMLNLLQVQCRNLVLLQCLDGRIEGAAEGSQERNDMAAKLTELLVGWPCLLYCKRARALLRDN